MNGIEKGIGALSRLFESKEGLRFLTTNVASICIFIYIHIFWIDLKTLHPLYYLYFIIILVIVWLIVYSSDPFRFNGKSIASKIFPEVSFFWSTLPSQYLLRRCDSCKNQNCSNRLYTTESKYISIWFREIFHKYLKSEVRITLQKGFLCRLVFYIKYTLFFLSIITVLTLAFRYYVFAEIWSLDQIIFLLFTTIIYLIISLTNNPKKPNGVWRAEREINMHHIHWMRDNEDILKSIVCKIYEPVF